MRKCETGRDKRPIYSAGVVRRILVSSGGGGGKIGRVRAVVATDPYLQVPPNLYIKNNRSTLLHVYRTRDLTHIEITKQYSEKCLIESFKVLLDQTIPFHMCSNITPFDGLCS